MMNILIITYHSIQFQTNLAVDYDPKNISHHVRYICLENRSNFNPNASIEPYLREYDIPSEYSVSLSLEH